MIDSRGEVTFVTAPRSDLTLRFESSNEAMERFFGEQIIRGCSITLMQSVKMWALYGGPISRLLHRGGQDVLMVKLTPEGQIVSRSNCPQEGNASKPNLSDRAAFS
ncbi:MAG: hypothetical protein ACRERE_17520 [Candidatus Entotheonellia bacterium]